VILEMYNLMIQFLEENGVLIALLIAVVETVKPLIHLTSWYKGWMMTLVAFVIAFIMAIPETGFIGIVWVEYIAHGVGLGLVGTGLYKTGATLIEKAGSFRE